jgi:hypothetical protein
MLKIYGLSLALGTRPATNSVSRWGLGIHHSRFGMRRPVSLNEAAEDGEYWIVEDEQF